MTKSCAIFQTQANRPRESPAVDDAVAVTTAATPDATPVAADFSEEIT